jgi:hypothetical protein
MAVFHSGNFGFRCGLVCSIRETNDLLTFQLVIQSIANIRRIQRNKIYSHFQNRTFELINFVCCF